ncbi:[protein-PII] uridylyltransferase [Actinocorallia herbida]|uniref:[protein-PII] uridylyltransferase n=1 Tax=Actinocorallia herbida TaxID=58109 RepID=UPI001FECCD65|nr:[protein-PII] uridylyltransferase [Actinocorallia herbida]
MKGLSFATERATRVAELDEWLAELVADAEGVALVAVGSLGRRDLTPGGDLDLVLLHEGRADIAELAEKIWYPVWDRGLQLDHSVRTVAEARAVAGEDLKALMGLLHGRCVAGDRRLAEDVRSKVLADWRASARTRLPELREMTAERWERLGELAFLLEGDVKDAKGGLRDVHVMQAVVATWAVPEPSSRVRAAYDTLLDIRHALHKRTGRSADRLLLQEQDGVAEELGLADGIALLGAVAEAARTISYAADTVWRNVERFCAPPARAERTPIADGLVEYQGEVVLARGANLADPSMPLRAAAASANAGLPLAPATLDQLAKSFTALPVPWPESARTALVSLLGAGPAAIPVWEGLDQVGLVVRMIPDWTRVRNRPQRNAVHKWTVDRHLMEAAAGVAARIRDSSRPDLLLVGAFLHDIGKDGSGRDHSIAGAEHTRVIAAYLGFPKEDVEVLEAVVLHHLLLPDTATRRDLDDPRTIETVAEAVGTPLVLELLHALAAADAGATGPAAWGSWKARLIDELVRRTGAALRGDEPPRTPAPTSAQLALARHDGVAVRVSSSAVRGTWARHTGGSLSITVVAWDRPGLLWQAAGVLALHRLVLRTARTFSHGDVGGGNAVIEFTAQPEFGSPPEPASIEADLRRALAGRLDVADRLERRAKAVRTRPGVPVAPPRVTFVEEASSTATVVEVRAHDRPGLLWRIGRVLGDCGLHIRAAKIDTLGSEAVDVFYVVGHDGGPVTDDVLRGEIEEDILSALG